MDFVTQSVWFPGTGRCNKHNNLREYIGYVCVWLVVSAPFASCALTQTERIERIIIKESLKQSKIAVEYGDDSGYKQVEDDFDWCNYAEKARVNSSPIKGQLVHVQTLFNKSELGCSAMNPELVPKTGQWIALIKRGDCNFNDKIYFAAKNSSASAVIIYKDSVTRYDNDERTQVTMTTASEGGHNGTCPYYIYIMLQ